MDGGDAGPPSPPPSYCDASGWHLDCTFGNDGYLTTAASVQAPARVASTMDDAGTVYFVLSSSQLADSPALVAVLADGGSTTVDVDGGAEILDVRAVAGAALAALAYRGPAGSLAAELLEPDGGVVVLSALSQQVTLDSGVQVLLSPFELLQVDGTTWTAAATDSVFFGPTGAGIISFSTATGSGTFDPTGSASATAAVSIGTTVWFIGPVAQGYEEVSGGKDVADDSCAATGVPFGDITDIAGLPVAVGATVRGYTLETLGTRQCGALATVTLTDGGAAPAGPLTAGPLFLARGTVTGAGDSLAVIGAAVIDGVEQLYVDHLPIRVDGGAPLALLEAGVATSGITLDPTSVVVGRPQLAGEKIHVPLIVTRSTVNPDGGAALSTEELVVARLLYTSP
jgi:hypothetical protein